MDEWKEKVGGKRVMNEGRQKANLHTVLPLLHKSDASSKFMKIKFQIIQKLI